MTAQNMGTKILTEAGYEVVAVSNGSAALKKIAEHKPDLVILDVYMPGYSGLEVCEKLRNSIDTLNTPVLLTVGKMEPYRREDANRVKADGIIIKPFEASDLLAVIKQLEERIVPVTTTAVGDQTMYLERPTTLTDEYRQEEFSVQSATVEAAGITQQPPLPQAQRAIEVPDYMASTSVFSDLLHLPAAATATTEAPAPVVEVQPEPAPAMAETSAPFEVPPAAWNWDAGSQATDAAAEYPQSTVQEEPPPPTQKIAPYREPEVETVSPVPVHSAPEEIAVPLHIAETSDAGLSVPDMLTSYSVEPAPSNVAQYTSAPSVDPALVTDRTEITSFATRFGVQNVEPVSDGTEPEAAAAEIETFAAQETDLEPPPQPETSAPDDFEARVAAAMSAYEQPEGIAAQHESWQAEVQAVEPVADTVQPDPLLEQQVSAASHSGPLVSSFVHDTAHIGEDHGPTVAETAESAIDHYGHEIAANVTSELPTASAAISSVSANPEVISQIVHRVLDRLKPHLIEEIIRELASGKSE